MGVTYPIVEMNAHESSLPPNFYTRRQPKNHSDSINSTCSCVSGTVLLFYCYEQTDTASLSRLLLKTCIKLDLFGKLRIACEGFNCTLGGEDAAISEFIAIILKYLNRSELIDDKDFITKFFKPTAGCKHKFDDLSIKIVNKLFPVGEVQPKSSTISDYISPPDTVLTPPEFHHAITSDPSSVLLDIRNYYETRIGKFANAITLPIRKYSSIKPYLDNHPSLTKNKTVYVYCTGGVRCESISSILLSAGASKVFSLQGGIHNYLEWIDKVDLDSHFKGVNYVFDSRGSLGIPKAGLISTCFRCQTPTKEMSKCKCHLVLVWCGCGGELWCCNGCLEDKCDCEVERRKSLNSTEISDSTH